MKRDMERLSPICLYAISASFDVERINEKQDYVSYGACG